MLCPLSPIVVYYWGKIDTQVIFLCSYGWDFQSSMREAGQLVPCETKALFIFAGDSFASCWRRG